MKTYCVYCHTSPSGKKYVGISCDPEKRWNSGRGYAKNYRFHRAIRKYGWNSFSHVVIADNLSVEDASKLERSLIEEGHLTDYKYGYNLRDGGDGSFSPESRAKMSKSRIGNTNSVGHRWSAKEKQRISDSLSKFYSSHENPMKGKHHSAETIEKLKQREVSAETREKMSVNHTDVSGDKNPSARAVRQLSLSGDAVCDYAYAKLAADQLHIDLSSIIKCCKGKQKTCGGYRWVYL